MTPDNETLYGWHLMPLHLCHEHEKELMENPPSGPAADYTETSAFKILANDPNARVVVSCMSRPHLLPLRTVSDHRVLQSMEMRPISGLASDQLLTMRCWVFPPHRIPYTSLPLTIVDSVFRLVARRKRALLPMAFHFLTS